MKERLFLMNKIFVIFGVIAIVMFVSCSTEKEDLFPSVSSDTSSEENVELISNTSKGLWGDDKQMSLEEELTIGKEYGNDEEMFGYIKGIAFDGEGNIFFADSYELTVKIFNEHGKFIEALKTSKFKIRVMGIASFADGKFMLTGMRFGGDFADYRIIIVDHSFENILAEYGEDFPIYQIGMDYFPNFSDVWIISGSQLYYTSPSEYKIVLFDKSLAKSKIIKKSHPKMFVPQYVRGFYSDFNGIENMGMVSGNYIVGVSYSNTAEIPLFKQKMEFINFVDNEKELCYQLDIFDGNFQFLTSVEIPPERRLAGIDSEGRLYFIENDPFPRLIRYVLKTE